MLTDAELAAMRETSESAMPDACTVVRPAAAGAGTIDPVTGVFTPTTGTTIFTGACRMRPPSSEEVEVLHGDIEVVKQRFTTTFPFDIAQLHVGDVVTFTDSSDPRFAGRSYKITGYASGSFHIDRRVALEAVE